jgi:trehalose 6-phosphate synthase
VRVDRIDLSKNPLRGFLAFEQLLRRNPKIANDVLFLALLYPSRQNIEAYRRYYAECTAVARRINDTFPKAEPVALHFEDDYHRSLGAMRVHDVLLVNPVYDGLNLVAKEGSIANRTNGVLILSRNAGVFEEIGRASIAVNPFDVTATADALETALSMAPSERSKLSAAARRASTRSSPERWSAVQLEAAGVEPSAPRRAPQTPGTI